MLGKAGFVAVTLMAAGVWAHSLNPRELYNEMYPVETLKRDAFHICNDADPTFVRAVRVDREACFDSMPHAIEVALGRIRAGGALTMAALLDPLHQAELLRVVSTPPRQPIIAPRSFANTEWARALSPSCVGGVPRARSAAVALNSGANGNLPPLTRAEPAGLAWQAPGPAIPLPPGTSAGSKSATGTPTFDPLPTPDVGDSGPPAIVPLAPSENCGGA